MKDILKKAIEGESEDHLIKCLDYQQSWQIDSADYELIEKALTGTWHRQHEDLVNTIYLEGLRDDRFVEPILKIALERDIFRREDYDLEPALRKCVHALKMINSKKSNEALKRLETLNNDNVKFVLEMYE